MNILKQATIACALLGAFFPTAYAETIELTFNQWMPSSHPTNTQGLHPWFKKVAAVTGGRVTITPSKKAILPPNTAYQGIVNGTIDVHAGVHGYNPGQFPLSEMVEHPLSSFDAGVSSAAYWEVWEKHFQPAGMHSDVVILAMHNTSGGNIHMRSTPVETINDLVDQRIRISTPGLGRIMERIGAIPIKASINQNTSMFRRAEIDGTAITDQISMAFKLRDYVNAVTHIPGGLYSNSIYVAVNKEQWSRISPEDQEAIRAISGKALSRRMGELSDVGGHEAQLALQEKLGDKYIIASPEFISDLQWTALGEQEEWIFKANQLGVDGEAAIAMFNKLRKISE